MDEKKLIQMFTSLLDEKLQPLNERMDRIESGQEKIIGKLDNLSKQVATNTEKLTRQLC